MYPIYEFISDTNFFERLIFCNNRNPNLIKTKAPGSFSSSLKNAINSLETTAIGKSVGKEIDHS
jgi:hypothetical protein